MWQIPLYQAANAICHLPVSSPPCHGAWMLWALPSPAASRRLSRLAAKARTGREKTQFKWFPGNQQVPPGLRAHLLRAGAQERTKPVNPCGTSKLHQSDSGITLRGTHSISRCFPEHGQPRGPAEPSDITQWHRKSLGN